MRKTMTIFAAAVLSVACNKAEFVDLIELGAVSKTVYAESEAYGSGAFDIISNVDYEVRNINCADWLAVTSAGKDKLTFDYTSNNSFKRQGLIVISHANRHDTLAVRQPGIYEEYISFPVSQIDVAAEGGSFTVEIQSNLLDSELQVEELKGYIEDISLGHGRLSFTVPASTRRDTKTYGITVFSTDGWGEKVSSTLYVVQQANE